MIALFSVNGGREGRLMTLVLLSVKDTRSSMPQAAQTLPGSGKTLPSL